MAYNVGDKYKYHSKITNGTKRKKTLIKDCVIVQECKTHITVDVGNYKVTVLKADLYTGEEKLEKVI